MASWNRFRTLEEAFVYATECNLATLEILDHLKSTSHGRCRRQAGICAGMLVWCSRIGVHVANDVQAGRVKDLLMAGPLGEERVFLERLLQKEP